MRGVVILGSTGKIGTQALDIIREHKKRFRIVALIAGTNSELLAEQIREFSPAQAVISDRTKADGLKKTASIPIMTGEEAIISCVTSKETDIVINAMVGRPGLMPSLEALAAGKTLGLAHKETMVLAGNIAMEIARATGGVIIPIDSEHSAIYQSLKSGTAKEIRRIILTMGTGKIAALPAEKLQHVTMDDVMARKTWDMGTKIAIDSATCVNKAFEIIEAGHLFSLSPRQIDVMVHPEYICHSLVEFQDGSIITELGTPDMRRYIQYALFYPERPKAKVSGFVDLLDRPLTFRKPPLETFPCLGLGWRALSSGGTTPAVFHGADTAAADAFRNGKIRFTDIPSIIERTMDAHRSIPHPTISDIFSVETWAEDYARRLTEEYA